MKSSLTLHLQYSACLSWHCAWRNCLLVSLRSNRLPRLVLRHTLLSGLVPRSEYGLFHHPDTYIRVVHKPGSDDVENDAILWLATSDTVQRCRSIVVFLRSTSHQSAFWCAGSQPDVFHLDSYGTRPCKWRHRQLLGSRKAIFKRYGYMTAQKVLLPPHCRRLIVMIRHS